MKIEHVALYVNDLEAAKDFFVRYLDAVPNEGYHNPRTDFRSYFLKIFREIKHCTPKEYRMKFC